MSADPAEGLAGAPGRVVVVGAGAIGSLLSALLGAAGSEVALIDRHATDGDLDSHVTVVEPTGRTVTARVHRVASAAAVRDDPDLAILAVKTHDVEAALPALARWPDLPVLTIQNGVGAEELVRAARPAAGLIAGSITAPVEWLEGGGFGWRGRGGIALAPLSGPVDPLVDGLVRTFTTMGLPSRRMGNARAMKWSKLLVNLPANALCALLDLDPRAVYADAALFDVERRQVLEAFAVMRALGLRPVALHGADARLLVLGARLPPPLSRPILGRVIGGARGGKPPSLQLHLREGRGPSEVTWMSGAVAREGARLGVPTPVNARLATLVESASTDPAVRARYVGRPDRLLEDIRPDADRPDAEPPTSAR